EVRTVIRRFCVPPRGNVDSGRIFHTRYTGRARDPRACETALLARRLAVDAQPRPHPLARMDAGTWLHTLSLAGLQRGASALHTRPRLANASPAGRDLH